MVQKVSETLQLDGLNKIVVVAGDKGLDRAVASDNIADHKFVEGLKKMSGVISKRMHSLFPVWFSLEVRL